MVDGSGTQKIVMKKIHNLLLLLLFIAGCSKEDDVIDPIDPPTPPVLCEVDYDTLQAGINKRTSHFQPTNLPFVNATGLIGAQGSISSINTYQVFQQHLNLNGNDTPDLIVVEIDHNTESNGTAHVFVDNYKQYSFDMGTHAIRQLEVGDLDGNGFDDVVFISTGIDREPYTGDPIVAAYLSTSGAVLDIIEESRSYRHAGALGDLDNDGDLDIFAIDNLQFQNDNGMEKIIWYENRGQGAWTIRPTNIPNIVLQNTIHVELVDLNYDGILDIIGGTSEWRSSWMDNLNLPETVDERTKVIIGQGNGQFYWDDPVVIEPIEGWGVITDIDVYDIDSHSVEVEIPENRQEIIITRTSGPGSYQEGNYYNGFKIQIIKGNPSGYYTDKVLDMPSGWGQMWIYNTMIYDVNKDCILDLVPENDRTYSNKYYEGTEDGNYIIKTNN